MFHANFITGKHSLIYQNSFSNEAGGPNAMILPILGTNLVIHDIGSYDVLNQAITQTKQRGAFSDDYTSEMSCYDIIVAQPTKEAVQNALECLHQEKRPVFSEELIEWYRWFYGPNITLAICCFNGSGKAKPIYIEYDPIQFSIGFWPGIQDRNGKAPYRLQSRNEYVERDHDLVLGCLLPKDMEDHFTQPVVFTHSVPEVLLESRFRYIKEQYEGGGNYDWFMKLWRPETNSWTMYKERSLPMKQVLEI